MRSIELNLASRPFRNNTLVWGGYALLAVLVVGFTAWNTVTFVDTRRKLDELRNEAGSIESRLAAVDQRERSAEGRIAKHDVRYLATRTSRANEFIQRKAFSWTKLFTVLEQIQPYEVKMASVRPIFGAEGGAAAMTASASGAPEAIPVSVDGIAKTVEAFFDFEDQLIRDQHIDRIEPARSNRAKNGEILFTLSFLYYPEGLEKKADPEQAEALHEATAPTDAATGEDEPEGQKKTQAQPAGAQPAEAKLQPQAPPPYQAGTDPGRRPLFKSTGKHSEKPAQPAPKKEANR